MKTDLEIFDEQLRGLVNKDRMETYGHPADHFNVSGMLKRILRDAYPRIPPAHLHAMEMIIDKLVRLGHTPTHLDSWIDIAGYARCAVMLEEGFKVPKEEDEEISMALERLRGSFTGTNTRKFYGYPKSDSGKLGGDLAHD